MGRSDSPSRISNKVGINKDWETKIVAVGEYGDFTRHSAVHVPRGPWTEATLFGNAAQTKIS